MKPRYIRYIILINLILIFILISPYFIFTNPLRGKTLDDLIAEAQYLLSLGWTSGHVKEYMEIKYEGYLTRDQINQIVNYAENPNNNPYPVELISIIQTANIGSDGFTGVYTLTPTGISGLSLIILNPTSARGKGMGNTFSSLYNDPELVYINPAGVLQAKKHSMGFSVTSLALKPDISTTAGVSLLYSHKFTTFSLGGSLKFFSELIDNPTYNFSYLYRFTTIQISLGKKFFNSLKTGIMFELENLLYYYYFPSDSTTPIEEGSKLGLRMDIGAAYNYKNFIYPTVTLKTYSKFKFSNFTNTLPDQILLGCTLKPMGSLNISPDLNYIIWKRANKNFNNTLNFHIGLEYAFLISNPKFNTPISQINTQGNIIFIRTGIWKENPYIEKIGNLEMKSRMHFTIGLGYKFRIPLNIDIGLDFAENYFNSTFGLKYAI